MDWRTLFLSPDGRISRQTFWIGVLILLGVNVLLGWIPLVGFFVWAVSVYCGVCINSKRLHDMGRSGWLQAVPWAVWVVAMVIGLAVGGASMMAGWAGGAHSSNAMMMGAAGGFGLMMVLVSLAMLVFLGFLLWVGLTPGQPEANKYGDPPPASPLPAA